MFVKVVPSCYVNI